MKKYFVVTNSPDSSPELKGLYDSLEELRRDYPSLLYLAVYKCEWDGGKIPTFTEKQLVPASVLLGRD